MNYIQHSEILYTFQSENKLHYTISKMVTKAELVRKTFSSTWLQQYICCYKSERRKFSFTVEVI